MSEHQVSLDFEKMAQDIKNIRYFLQHLEDQLEKAIHLEAVRLLENKDAESELA